MDARIKIRCSSLDSLMACGPSVLDRDGQVRIDAADDATALGRLVHSLAGDYIDTGEFDIKAEIARRGLIGADAEDAAYLMSQVRRLWDDLGRHFPDPKTERAIVSDVLGDGVLLTGTTDVISTTDEGAIILDWKSGDDHGYANQLAGYAYCAWVRLGRQPGDVITVILAFPRHRFYRVVKWTAAKLAEWEDNLIKNVLRDYTYRPGDQCARCPIYAGCEARQAIVQATVRGIMLPGRGAVGGAETFLANVTRLLGALTPDNKDQPEVGEGLLQLRFRLGLVKTAVADAEELVKQAVERVGPIKLADGGTLQRRAVETKHVDAEKAIPVLRRHLADTEIARCMKLSLPQLQDAVAAKRTRGEKGTARTKIKDDLTAAGALSVSTHYRLEEVDPATEKPNELEDLRSERPATGGPTGAEPGDRPGP